METSPYVLSLFESVDDYINCDTILLYNSIDQSCENLTKENASRVFSQVKSIGLRLTIEDSNNYFLFKSNNGVISGFNNIFFLGSNDKIIGIVSYINIQGRNRNCKIILKKKDESSSDVFSGVTENSLDHISSTSNNITKLFLGDFLKDYTSQNKIKKFINNSSEIYTSSLEDSIKNNKVINLGEEHLSNNDILKIKLLKNAKIDTQFCDYTNFKIGYHMNDIVLYEWKDAEYNKYQPTENSQYFNIISLTRTNNFGDPISYVKRSSNNIPSDWGGASRYFGGAIIPKYDDENIWVKTLYTSGRYFICKVSDNSSYEDYKIKVFNSEGDNVNTTGNWVNLYDDENLFLDEWGTDSKIMHLKSEFLYKDSIYQCPDLVNNFSNFKLFQESNSGNIQIVKKTGNWFLFKYKKWGNVFTYIYSGIYGNLLLSEEDIEKSIIINDSNILLKENGYYVLYNCYKKSYSTERLRQLSEGGILGNKNINGVNILFNDGGINDDIYTEYYAQGDIEIISTNSSLYSTSLNKFRKNCYPTEISGIPNIIGSLEGLIFFTTNDNKNINYL